MASVDLMVLAQEGVEAEMRPILPPGKRARPGVLVGYLLRLSPPHSSCYRVVSAKCISPGLIKNKEGGRNVDNNLKLFSFCYHMTDKEF